MRNISCFALNYNLVRMKNKWLMPLVFHWFYFTLNIHTGPKSSVWYEHCSYVPL